MPVTWLDKPRSQWWTKEAVASVVNANIGKGVEIDGVTHMMVAAYKQWQDVEDLLNGDVKNLEAIKKRHNKYEEKIQEAANWRKEVMAGEKT